MDYFAGLDVSVKETSVCIVDDAGKIVREVRVASEPEALLQVLANNTYLQTDRKKNYAIHEKAGGDGRRSDHDRLNL